MQWRPDLTSSRSQSPNFLHWWTPLRRSDHDVPLCRAETTWNTIASAASWRWFFRSQLMPPSTAHSIYCLLLLSLTDKLWVEGQRLFQNSAGSIVISEVHKVNMLSTAHAEINVYISYRLTPKTGWQTLAEDWKRVKEDLLCRSIMRRSQICSNPAPVAYSCERMCIEAAL